MTELADRIGLVRLAGLASVLAATLLIGLKVWAWFATDSIALLSSLADSILDLCASLITLIAVKFALEPADKEHRFGHGKLEALAGLAQALIIFGSAIYVGVEAAIRMLTPAPVTEPAIGVAVMGASLVITAALVLLQRYVVRRTGSIAIRADSIHYQADFMTNIAVIAAIGLSAGLGWHAADPLLGIAVVIFILISIRQIVQQSMDVLLDRELPTETRERILEPRAMRRSATYTTCAPGPQVLLTLFNFTWNSTQRSHYKRRIRSVLRSNWL
jgi:ferrous-iron efflux pump FieF